MMNILSADTTLHERTNLSIYAIIKLLATCVNSRHFQVGDKFYKQEVGVPMGSPLLSSNLNTKDTERRVIDTYDLKPKIWLM